MAPSVTDVSQGVVTVSVKATKTGSADLTCGDVTIAILPRPITLTDESRAAFWSKENPFSDVAITNWYNNAVSTLYNAGVLSGYPDGTFRPDRPITRAEFAAIAAKFSQVVYNGGNSFADTPESHWAARFISLAENQGWVNGYPDGTFKPDQRITRAEAIILINRVLERATETGHMAEEMVPGPTILPEPGTTKRFRRQPTLISTCV